MIVRSKEESEEAAKASFEQVFLPHLSAAYNLARWLTRDDPNAEDIVQEAYLRAFEKFGSFRGEAARPWLLAIVRNVCYAWLRQNKPAKTTIPFGEPDRTVEADSPNPGAAPLLPEGGQTLRRALEELPAELREVIILRELEGMSYKELSAIAGIPPGAVMSRLARARERLLQLLVNRANNDNPQQYISRNSASQITTT